MNLYVVVEGKRTEPILYRKWLPQLLPGFREIQRIEDALDHASGDSFFLVAGHGYPSYMKRIQNAVKDCVAIRKPFHLVVCVDAEDVSIEEKFSEIEVLIHDILREEDVEALANTVVLFFSITQIG